MSFTALCAPTHWEHPGQPGKATLELIPVVDRVSMRTNAASCVRALGRATRSPAGSCPNCRPGTTSSRKAASSCESTFPARSRSKHSTRPWAICSTSGAPFGSRYSCICCCGSTGLPRRPISSVFAGDKHVVTLGRQSEEPAHPQSRGCTLRRECCAYARTLRGEQHCTLRRPLQPHHCCRGERRCVPGFAGKKPYSQVPAVTRAISVGTRRPGSRKRRANPRRPRESLRKANKDTKFYLKVAGSNTSCPSAFLRAVVQSPSLTLLSLQSCRFRAEDVEAMAAALTLHPPRRTSATWGDGVTAVTPPALAIRLQTLEFKYCAQPDRRLEKAYASLIGGGVLVHLRMPACFLSGTFAMAAAAKLCVDKHLRELSLHVNNLPVVGLCAIIEALKVNVTLKTLSISIQGTQHVSEVAQVLDVIRAADAFSRFNFKWNNPQGSHLLEAACSSKENMIYANLDGRAFHDMAYLLDVLTSSRNVSSAWIELPKNPTSPEIRKILSTFAYARHLRKLHLSVCLPQVCVIALLRALALNRSVHILVLSDVMFESMAVRTLGHMVQRNRTMSILVVDLPKSIPSTGYSPWWQRFDICKELEEAVPHNHFLLGVKVTAGDHKNRATSFTIMDALRRNSVRVNKAVRFVSGSMERKDALAFDTVKHSSSVVTALLMRPSMSMDDMSNDAEAAMEKVAEARRVLASNYFILTGVVKAKVVCNADSTGATTFDKLDEDLQAHICSYLRLTDVADAREGR
ncbi:uncharacterized protein [Dermacentor albipictus]|uniref:uncharacterized protein isoform X2 n=1 Tax=Dermacentor albipictus TaxID=60249 RepID=UPI0038FD2D2B